MLSLSLGTVYGIGLGITIAVMLLIKMFLLFLGIHSKQRHWFRTILRLVFWPITWGVLIYYLYKMYMEESRRDRQS